MSQTPITPRIRQQVIERAAGRCEYCLMHQDWSPYSHEVDHLIARKHGGKTVLANLALACLPCNRRKGSDLTAIDPASGEIVPLFNPRMQAWDEHLVFNGAYIIGMTPTGRATVFLLALNMPERVVKRQALMAEGLYP
jgi:hypothetical protein